MKIKERLNRTSVTIFALFCLWIISLLPKIVLDVLAVLSMSVAVILFGVVCVVYFKKMKKSALILLFSCLVLPLSAQETYDPFALCNSYEESVEQNKCIYEQTVSQWQSSLSSDIQGFDLKETKADEVQTAVNKATQIMNAYFKLPQEVQDSYGNPQECELAQDEPHVRKKAKKRVEIIQENADKSPICTALAMTALANIHDAQNETRAVETVPAALAASQQKCWPCDIVLLLIVLSNRMANNAAPDMANVGMFFLMWALAFWLVIKVGCLMLSRNVDGKGYGGAQFLKELLARVMLVGLVALIISNTAQNASTNLNNPRMNGQISGELGYVYEEVINPIFGAVAGIGEEIAGALRSSGQNMYDVIQKRAAATSWHQASARRMLQNNYCSGTDISTSSVYTQLITKTGITNGFEGAVVGKDLSQTILCLVQSSFRAFEPLAVSGSIFTSYAIKNPYEIGWGWFSISLGIPRMPEIFIGPILTIICWLLSLGVAFKAIDIMLRVAMIALLLPCFIAFSAFPLTREYAKKALKFFVSAMMGMVEFAIGTSIVVAFIYQGLDNIKRLDKLLDAMVAKDNSDYVPNLFDKFTENGMFLFIVICALCWLATKLFEASDNFFNAVFETSSVSSFGGDSGMNKIQQEMRRKVGKGVQTVRGPMGKVLGHKLGNTKLGRGAKDVGKFVSEKASTAKRYFDKARTGVSSKVKKGTDKLGGGIDKGMSKIGNAADKGISAAGKTADKGITAAGKGVDAAANAAGSAVSAAGSSAGGSMMSAGTALTGTGIGAIIGVPLIAAGAVVTGASKVAGVGIKATGKVARAAAWTAGKAVRAAAWTAGKTTKTAAKTVGKAGKYTVKGTEAAARGTVKAGTYAAKTAGKQAKRGVEDFFYIPPGGGGK